MMLLHELAVALCFAVTAASITAVISFIKYKRTKRFYWKTELSRLLLVSYLAAVVAVLVIPNFSVGIDDNDGFFFYVVRLDSGYNLRLFKTISEQFELLGSGNPIGLINLFVNGILFMPYPVLLKLNNQKLKLWYCFLIPFVTIAVCELLQYGIGRASDIDDVLLNSAGVLIGILLYQSAYKIISVWQNRQDNVFFRKRIKYIKKIDKFQ